MSTEQRDFEIGQVVQHASGSRARIVTRPHDGTAYVSIENVGVFECDVAALEPFETVEVAQPDREQQIRFVTDDEIAKRLGQLEYRLLTAKAEIPGMIRELQDIRHQLEQQ